MNIIIIIFQNDVRCWSQVLNTIEPLIYKSWLQKSIILLDLGWRNVSIANWSKINTEDSEFTPYFTPKKSSGKAPTSIKKIKCAESTVNSLI